MSFWQRWATGINLANDSFKLLFKHLQLTLYTLMAALIAVGIPFVLYVIYVYNPENPTTITAEITIFSIFKQLELTGLPLVIASLLFSFVIMFVDQFFYVSLSHHTMHILRREQRSFADALTACSKKWLLIIQWAAISLVVNTLLSIPFMYAYTWGMGLLVSIVILACSTAWNLLTFLVIPFIALERITLTRALTLSYETVKGKLWEVVGGLIWIAIVGVILKQLILLPGIVLGIAKLNTALLVLVQLVAPGITALVTAAAIILRTIFFDKFYEQEIEGWKTAEHDLMM
ncbi:MAG TPA: hypothetical protein VFF04_03525 [Candidatus Babeliales bacterium]|nr:hypothetical protein [Candidatus Babeliales bacterium]